VGWDIQEDQYTGSPRKNCFQRRRCSNSSRRKHLRDHLAVEPIVQTDGVVKVPGGARLGIEIDRPSLSDIASPNQI
jgi:hypothetical protein